MDNLIETNNITLQRRAIRLLRADEIECRIGQTAKDNSWYTILLYKDARCDMSMLDELVGADNWQRDHKEIKGNLYCGVGIRCGDAGWVWKWDCGTESNTEKEKGEASDSFKRACVNWGIGRELYTAPKIFINAEAEDIKGGKIAVYLSVKEIEYNAQREIVRLVLVDKKGRIRYSFGGAPVAQPKPAKPAKQGLKKGELITWDMVEDGLCNSLVARLRTKVGTPEFEASCESIKNYYRWDSPATFTAIVMTAKKN